MTATETNAEKFKRLANSRLNKAVDAIATLEPLAVTAAYDYTPEQVDIILEALNEAVDAVSEAFTNGGPVARKRDFF